MSPWQKVRAARRREAYFVYFSFLSVIFLSYFSFLSGFFLPSCLGWANPYPTDSVAATTGFMGFVLFLFPFGFLGDSAIVSGKPLKRKPKPQKKRKTPK